MQKMFCIWLMMLIFSGSCNPNGNTINRTDPVEAGREFIDASLKGNYAVAKKYVLEDSVNMEYFNRLESFNNKLSPQEKNGYKNANIIIDSIQNISDSITIINYSNTFKKSPARVKLVKKNNEWLVDFKFTFSGTSAYGNE
ncbi:MAG: hypothetical protein ABIN97_03780 [Ginsengibacter sp.]